MNKKLSSVVSALLIAGIVLCIFCSCNDNTGKEPAATDNPITIVENTNDDTGVDDTIGTPESSPFSVAVSKTDDGETVTLNRLPESVSDLESVDLSDEYVSCALIMASFSCYESNPDLTYELIDYLKGPDSLSDFDKNFIKGQFEQYPYVARSYMENAAPENDYTVDGVVFHVFENPYSRDEEGYVKLYLKSGGADSERGMTLRHKGSTDQWFLFSDTYKGMLAGIRQPQSNDPWN